MHRFIELELRWDYFRDHNKMSGLFSENRKFDEKQILDSFILNGNLHEENLTGRVQAEKFDENLNQNICRVYEKRSV